MGGGRVRWTPPVVGEEVTGQVVRSWLMRDWAQSRAVEARRASRGWGGEGGGVVAEEVAEVEGWGDGFRDGWGARGG